jgi:hypothetical protein
MKLAFRPDHSVGSINQRALGDEFAEKATLIGFQHS